MVEQQRLVTVDGAARILAISRAQVYVLIRRGDLMSIRIGRSRRVPVGAIEEFIRAHSLTEEMLGESV